MTVSIAKLREAQQLSLGRNPKFTLVKATDVTGAPYLATDGFALQSNTEPVVAMLGVRLHAVAGRADGEVYITTVDDTATYTLTLNGTDYTYAASSGDDEEDIINGLIEDESTDEEATLALELATDDDNVKYIKITGVQDQTWTVAVSATGTGAMSKLTDATSVDYAIYAYHRSFGWWRVPNISKTSMAENDLDRYEIEGIERVDVRILTTDGRVYKTYAPSELEGT